MNIPPSIQSTARAGLEASSGGFFKGSAIRKAESALVDVVTIAGEGSGTAAAVRVGRETAAALADHPAARLAVLRQTLSTVEGGAASGVGFLSQFAYKLLDAIDGAKAGEARPRAVRATLDAIAETSKASPQGDYAAYMARLGHEIPNPVYTLNMLDRVNSAEVGDVTRPAWYACVGFSFAAGALYEGGAAQLGHVLQVVDPAVRARAEAAGDALVRGHLAREQAWADALGLSPDARLALHLGTLRVAGDEVACAPETALVLAWQATRQDVRMTADERARVVDHAFTEMRTASLPPESPAARWLRLHDTVGGLGLPQAYAQQVRSTAFCALVEGREPRVDTLAFDLSYGLEALDAATARGLFDAVADLVALPSADLDVAIFGLDLHRRAANTRPEVAAAFAERAWERLSALPSTRPDRNALVEMTRSALEKASAADRPALVVDGLERLTRLDTDAMQQAVVRAATGGDGPAPTVRQEDDFVMIGTVKVPRKAVKR